MRKQLTCFSRWIFSQRSYMAGVWQLWLRFKPLRLHKEILNSSCLLILLIQIISGIFRTPFTSIMLLLATVNLIQQKSKLQNQIFLLKKPISCVRKYLFGLLLFRKPFGKAVQKRYPVRERTTTCKKVVLMFSTTLISIGFKGKF